VELHGDEITKYRGFVDMKAKLADLFQGKFNVGTVEDFLKDHKAGRIAQTFLRLFEELMRTRKGSGR
jgi:hypothetical protein